MRSGVYTICPYTISEWNHEQDERPDRHNIGRNLLRGRCTQGHTGKTSVCRPSSFLLDIFAKKISMRLIKWARQMIDGREVCLGGECVDSGYLHCTDAQLQVSLNARRFLHAHGHTLSLTIWTNTTQGCFDRAKWVVNRDSIHAHSAHIWRL